MNVKNVNKKQLDDFPHLDWSHYPRRVEAENGTFYHLILPSSRFACGLCREAMSRSMNGMIVHYRNCPYKKRFEACMDMYGKLPEPIDKTVPFLAPVDFAAHNYTCGRSKGSSIAVGAVRPGQKRKAEVEATRQKGRKKSSRVPRKINASPCRQSTASIDVSLKSVRATAAAAAAGNEEEPDTVFELIDQYEEMHPGFTYEDSGFKKGVFYLWSVMQKMLLKSMRELDESDIAELNKKQLESMLSYIHDHVAGATTQGRKGDTDNRKAVDKDENFLESSDEESNDDAFFEGSEDEADDDVINEVELFRCRESEKLACLRLTIGPEIMKLLKVLESNGITVPIIFQTPNRIKHVYRIWLTNLHAQWRWFPKIVVQAKYKVACLWEESVQDWLFKLRKKDQTDEATNIKRGFVVNIDDWQRMDSSQAPLSTKGFMKSILAMAKSESKGWTMVDREPSGASSVGYYKIHDDSLRGKERATASMVQEVVASAMTKQGCAVNKSAVKATLSIVRTEGAQEVQHAHVDYKIDRFEAIYDYWKKGDAEYGHGKKKRCCKACLGKTRKHQKSGHGKKKQSCKSDNENNKSRPDADTYHSNVNLRMPWVMFSPLTDHGMYLAVWPDNYKEVDELGKVVFIPPGMILFMRGDTTHAGGFDNTMGVAGYSPDPTKRLHGYIYKRSGGKTTRQTDTAACYLYPVAEKHDSNRYDNEGEPPQRERLEQFDLDE